MSAKLESTKNKEMQKKETVDTGSVPVTQEQRVLVKDRRKSQSGASSSARSKMKSFLERDENLEGQPQLGEARRVAPFIKPASKLQKTLRAKDWQQRGLIEVIPEHQKIRHRILPRSVIGICLLLLAVGVGVAFSGAAFYAYYNNRLTENEESVARFVEGFDKQFNDAAGALDELRTSSISQIRGELEPLEGYVEDVNGVISLPQAVGDSVWLLETRNDDGVLIAGSSYAIVGHEGGTAFVTSYSLVKSATVEPAPPIEIVKDGQRHTARLWSWDEERDLALVVVDQAIKPLDLAVGSDQVDTVGSKVFAVGGVGGQGSTASPGYLLDNSQLGIQHTAPVGSLYVGGPLVTSDGKVLGMATTQYRPYGVDQGDVPQAPDVRSLCARVLQCSETSGVIDVSVGEVLMEAPASSSDSVRDGVEEAVAMEEEAAPEEAEG